MREIKYPDQFLVAYLRRIVVHEHGFGVAGSFGIYQLVGGVGYIAARVARYNGVDAHNGFKYLFYAPETARGKSRGGLSGGCLNGYFAHIAAVGIGLTTRRIAGGGAQEYPQGHGSKGFI